MYLEITIPAAEIERYQVYLTLMNHYIFVEKDGVKTASPLTSRELEVYSLLCYFNQKYSVLDEEARAKYINSISVRDEIKEKLVIDTNNYNNILNRLTNKYFIDGQPLYDKGFLNKKLCINLTAYEGIKFSF
jgi:hypothetical protein